MYDYDAVDHCHYKAIVLFYETEDTGIHVYDTSLHNQNWISFYISAIIPVTLSSLFWDLVIPYQQMKQDFTGHALSRNT